MYVYQVDGPCSMHGTVEEEFNILYGLDRLEERDADEKIYPVWMQNLVWLIDWVNHSIPEDVVTLIDNRCQSSSHGIDMHMLKFTRHFPLNSEWLFSSSVTKTYKQIMSWRGLISVTGYDPVNSFCEHVMNFRFLWRRQIL